MIAENKFTGITWIEEEGIRKDRGINQGTTGRNTDLKRTKQKEGMPRRNRNVK